VNITIYQPAATVSGPAYSLWFKILATLIVVTIAGYALDAILRLPLWSYGLGVTTLGLGMAVMLGISYYWFIRSTVTIDAQGITQTWLFDRRVAWDDVNAARVIGIPGLEWLFPPRLVVRSGLTITSFHGGSRVVRAEFARIASAYKQKQ